jgi:hypothetical protein
MSTMFTRSLMNVINNWEMSGNPGIYLRGDKLEWVNNASRRDLGFFWDFPGLASISNSLEVSDTNLASAEFPSLRSVGDTLYIQNNPKLSVVSSPILKTIGALIITGNLEFEFVAYLNELEAAVRIELIGSFTQ